MPVLLPTVGDYTCLKCPAQCSGGRSGGQDWPGEGQQGVFQTFEFGPGRDGGNRGPAAWCQHCMQHQLPPPLLMLPQSESDHSNNIRPSRANTRIAGEHTETSPDPTADSPPLGGSMEPIWDKWCPSLSNCGTKGCQLPTHPTNPICNRAALMIISAAIVWEYFEEWGCCSPVCCLMVGGLAGLGAWVKRKPKSLIPHQCYCPHNPLQPH